MNCRLNTTSIELNLFACHLNTGNLVKTLLNILRFTIFKYLSFNSGCDGNNNNFNTLEECQSDCHIIIDYIIKEEMGNSK